jgi:hypothetical protein
MPRLYFQVQIIQSQDLAIGSGQAFGDNSFQHFSLTASQLALSNMLISFAVEELMEKINAQR